VHRPLGPSSNVSATTGMLGGPRRYNACSKPPSGFKTPGNVHAETPMATSPPKPAASNGFSTDQIANRTDLGEPRIRRLDAWGRRGSHLLRRDCARIVREPSPSGVQRVATR